MMATITPSTPSFLFVLTAFHKTVTSLFYKAHGNKALMQEIVKHKGKKC